MHSDPIADLLTRIRNASRVDLPSTQAPTSKLKLAICQKLVEYGYLNSVTVQGRDLLITLPKGRLLNVRRVSKPGRRVYIAADGIKRVLSGYGISLLSTSKGLMSSTQARKERIGGEVLLEIY